MIFVVVATPSCARFVALADGYPVAAGAAEGLPGVGAAVEALAAGSCGVGEVVSVACGIRCDASGVRRGAWIG